MITYQNKTAINNKNENNQNIKTDINEFEINDFGYDNDIHMTKKEKPKINFFTNFISSLFSGEKVIKKNHLNISHLKNIKLVKMIY